MRHHLSVAKPRAMRVQQRTYKEKVTSAMCNSAVCPCTGAGVVAVLTSEWTASGSFVKQEALLTRFPWQCSCAHRFWRALRFSSADSGSVSDRFSLTSHPSARGSWDSALVGTGRAARRVTLASTGHRIQLHVWWIQHTRLARHSFPFSVSNLRCVWENGSAIRRCFQVVDPSGS